MKKVAVFGNAGGGKSTLSKRLAELTELPLHALDKIRFQPGGAQVPQDEYLRLHSEILAQDRWVVEGFGCLESTWARLAQADTLVYLDLPLSTHFLWVTKRCLQGAFSSPEGWPADSPILKSTLNSYRVLRLCHQKLTPRYREYVAQAGASKTVYHLRSRREIVDFLKSLEPQAG